MLAHPRRADGPIELCWFFLGTCTRDATSRKFIQIVVIVLIPPFGRRIVLSRYVLRFNVETIENRGDKKVEDAQNLCSNSSDRVRYKDKTQGHPNVYVCWCVLCRVSVCLCVSVCVCL